MADAEPAKSLFEMVGGMETFDRLVGRFYAGVDADPILRPMYPENLDTPRRHLTLFLVQYFGGPQTYSAERGHPRLRQRHFKFLIGPAVRDAWVWRMTAALESLDLPDEQYQAMLRYFEESATFLVNQPG